MAKVGEVTQGGGQLICTYFDENLLALLPAEQTEGLYGCLDYYQNVTDQFSKTLLARYRMAGGDEREWIRRTLDEHVRARMPDAG